LIYGRHRSHQLAIGIIMSAITLTLALFELCWRVGLSVARFFSSENGN
jgi:hypothetical protein